MCSWWSEKMAENEQLQPLPQRPPTIPQAPPVPTVDGLLAEVADEVRGPAPADSVEDRFGVRPGGDIGIAPRRGFATDAPPEKTLLDLTAEAQARLVRKATALGMLGPESERAKEAHDRAAMVAEATKAGAYTTSEDPTPGRRVDTRGVAGYTAGHGGGH